MSVERQALSALKWSALAKLGGQVVTWLVTLVVLRLLSPDDYGLMAISSVIISILASVAELGVGASIVQTRAISRDDLARIAGALVVLNLGLGLVAALSAPLAAAVFNDSRLADVVRVSAIHFLLNAASTVPQSLATRDMKFKWLASIELGSNLVASASTLALAWVGAGVWALVLGSLAGGVLRTCFLVVQGESVRPSFALRGIGRHLSFGGALTSGRMLWQLGLQSDILIAGRFLTQEAVGVYSVSLHLATLPMQKTMGILNQVAFPTVARLQGELPRLRARLLDASRLLCFVAIPLLWGVSAVAPEFVSLVLGPKWSGAVFPLQVMTLVVPISMLANVFSTAISALGKAWVELRSMLVTCIVLPGGFLVGVQWGVDGLALSWLITVPLSYCLNFPRSERVLGIRLTEIARSIHASVLAGALMYGAVSGARLLFGWMPDFYRLPALIAVGAATYLGAVSLLDRSIWADVRRVVRALRGS